MRYVAGMFLARQQGLDRSDFLYIVWLCWGIALLLYALGSVYYLWPVALMPLVLFVLLVERVLMMFGKKRDRDVNTTVIAVDACFKGELHVEGDLEVRGHFNGTVKLTGGALRIMQGGRVEGEVSAPHVFINGLLEGTCTATELDILENGKMQGIFKGGLLSICKGGNFVGQSQPTVVDKVDHVLQALSDSKPSEIKNNVKQLPRDGKVAEALAKQV